MVETRCLSVNVVEGSQKNGAAEVHDPTSSACVTSSERIQNRIIKGTASTFSHVVNYVEVSTPLLLPFGRL